MKRVATLAAAGALTLGLFALAAPKVVVPAAVAQEQAEGAWKGELVDLACYLSKGLRGEKHRKCAQMCAGMGEPVGLLTTDGKLFLLVYPHEGTQVDDVKKLCGFNAEVKGKVLERDGLRAIEVKSVAETKG